MTADEITAEAARRAMNLPGLNVSQRRAAAARIAGELTDASNAQAAADATAKAAVEAAAERARIAAVAKVGAAMDRPMAALRLALAGPLDAAGAQAVLATVPPEQAMPATLVLPTAADFGSAAAQAERARIAAILGHPEAEGRFPTAAAMAFQTAVDPATAVVALAGISKAVSHRGPSLAERSAAAGSFGPDFSGGRRSADDVWKKAVAASNRTAGFAASGDHDHDAQRSAELRAGLDRAMATDAEAAAHYMRGGSDD